MGSRPIQPGDAVWLHMDRPHNLMVVESLMTLAEPVDWERFLAVVQRRVIDRYPVFSQRPVAARTLPGLPVALSWTGLRWEDDPGFSLERHVHRATLPAPGGDAELQAHINASLGRPLERDRPLWELHLLDGYGEGSAIHCRLHHSLADGIALTRVLLSLTDDAPDGDRASSGVDADPSPDPVLAAGGDDCGTVGHLLGLVGEAEEVLVTLPRLLAPRRTGRLAGLAVQSAAIVGKLLLTQNPAAPLTGTAGVAKAAVWAPPIPLADVKAAGRRTGTTVNDVLVAALAGAVATYVREHAGAPVDLPTMVPVNLRPLDEPLPRELGNAFALVLFSLPSALETTFARLAETKRRMDEIKGSPEALITNAVVHSIGRTVPRLAHELIDFFSARASGVTTNVPGPGSPRYAAGTRITRLLGWVPGTGDQTLGTSIFTYDGAVHVGFKVDNATIPDVDRLLSAFVDETEALLALASP